ncbi:protein zwilch homolog [Electrophorus electricus]|uniref:protein zwilch homolog n=1 Tax=Electrophorus electricus TaxID=8005 RepID=UPI0015D0CA26|nr:protein zwilch homolog [Electrophorus electricus]
MAYDLVDVIRRAKEIFSLVIKFFRLYKHSLYKRSYCEITGMRTTIISEANGFIQFLKLCQDASKDDWFHQEDIRISKRTDEPLLSITEGIQPVFICEKMPPQTGREDSESTEETSFEGVPVKLQQQDIGPLPLTINRARQLLSWYTMCQNPNMSQVGAHVLHPLWIRCDMQDPAGTSWLGSETVYAGSKATAVKLYSVSCKGAAVDAASCITMDKLKQEHQNRLHSSTVLTKGWAEYNLFCSVKEESIVIDSQSSVTASFRWNDVEKMLETPPLSSAVTLHIKVAAGDIRSPMFQTYRELEFLLTLAEGLRTGEIEWLEPLVTQSAVDLTRSLIEELENIANAVPGQTLKGSENQKTKTDSVIGFNTMQIERGDLDFTEHLWEKMRKSVTSYQDITDSLNLVIKAVRFGQIKPWVHRDSSSSLSELIVKSYQHQVEPVLLAGHTPAIMLLELGLDKMRKDYINYLVGKELTTLNHLSYYLSSEVDLQEQVMRLRKLHHLLEILGTCSSFLSLPHERLFFFTQSCLQYYKTAPYDEEHIFEMQIKPALISHFYQTEQPSSWGVVVSSGQGSREVKTTFHLSDRPLVDHVTFDSDPPLEESLSTENEKTAYFRTMVCCSLASFG